MNYLLKVEKELQKNNRFIYPNKLMMGNIIDRLYKELANDPNITKDIPNVATKYSIFILSNEFVNIEDNIDTNILDVIFKYIPKQNGKISFKYYDDVASYICSRNYNSKYLELLSEKIYDILKPSEFRKQYSKYCYGYNEYLTNLINICAIYNNIDCAEYILDEYYHCRDNMSKDYFKCYKNDLNTAYDLAIENNNIEMSELLKKYGATSNKQFIILNRSFWNYKFYFFGLLSLPIIGYTLYKWIK